MERIESLALFPLADVVLLPDVSVPLRLFEPRYVEMIRDVLAGSHQIGMVAVRPEGLSQMPANPPIFDVGCLGQVTHSQERPDGTVEILLQGVRRFRIIQEESEQPGRLYRRAQVELLIDPQPSDAEQQTRLDQHRAQLFALLEQFLKRLDSEEPREHVVDAFNRMEPAQLINALSQALAQGAIERQQLLEADGIVSRFQIMCELLHFRLAEIAAGNLNTMSRPN